MIAKVQNSRLEYANRNNNAQSFKGAVDVLRFLNNSPAIGACAVDLGSMVIPRTIVDTTQRGPQAGTETGIREASSTANHAMVGMFGLGAATLVAGAINNKYNIKANKMFVNDEAIDLLGEYWKNAKGAPEEYVKNVFGSIEGLNGADWKKIGGAAEGIAKQLSDADFNLTKDLKQSIRSQIVKEIGSDGTIRLGRQVAEDGKVINKGIEQSLDVCLETVNSLGKAFSSAAKKVGGEDFVNTGLKTFITDLKRNKKLAALFGLAIPATIAVSVQPINRHLTKKRTGKDGFVGVEGRESDKSTKFKLEKLALAGAMGTFAFKTIGSNFKTVLNKIQFSSMIPNLNQFKMIYGLTIMSRLLSARDGNELRESSIKDFLGFANWLILGGMVSKLTARGLDKGLINYDQTVHGGETGFKKSWNWITKSSVKTYDEVLIEGAAKEGKSVLDGAGKALRFKELYKLVEDKATKVKVRNIAIAQIAGYLYSGIVLGVGIAKLNIFITNKVNPKKKEEHKTQDSKVTFYAQKKEAQSDIFANFKGIFKL